MSSSPIRRTTRSGHIYAEFQTPTMEDSFYEEEDVDEPPPAYTPVSPSQTGRSRCLKHKCDVGVCYMSHGSSNVCNFCHAPDGMHHGYCNEYTPTPMNSPVIQPVAVAHYGVLDIVPSQANRPHNLHPVTGDLRPKIENQVAGLGYWSPVADSLPNVGPCSCCDIVFVSDSPDKLRLCSNCSTKYMKMNWTQQMTLTAAIYRKMGC